MIRNTLIVVLAIALIGVSYFGYQERQQNTALSIQTENNYQRAFHQLAGQMDQLEEQIASTLVMNSREQLSPSLVKVWKTSLQAQNDISELPLSALPINQTEEFLAEIGDFSYQVAVRDLAEKPLTDEEMNHLKSLHEQSKNMKEQMKQMQAIVLQEQLRWVDVDNALLSNESPEDNTIIDGFKTINDQVTHYKNTNVQSDQMVRAKQEEKRLKDISGPVIDQQEAVKRAGAFIGKNTEGAKVIKNKKGAQFPFYSVTIPNGGKGEYLFDVTKKGGHIVWVLHERPMEKIQLSLYDAQVRAQQFLKQKGFTDFIIQETIQYDSIGLFTFVKKQQNVRIMPQMINIKVALDNGEIIGFDAKSYLMNVHAPQPSLTPVLTKEQALEKVNKQVDIQSEDLVVMTNLLGDDVLCYEFTGIYEDKTYRIFINAKTGHEEKVEPLKQMDKQYGKI